MRPFRGCVFILAIGLVQVLSSCSHEKPETQEDVQKWNLATLKGSYNSFGQRNPKWDKDAEDALAQFARTRTARADESEVLSDLVGESATSAVNEGCNDPMIRFLYVCYASRPLALSLPQRAEMFRSAAGKLQTSAYPSIRKFYASVSAARWLWSSSDTNYESSWPVVRSFRLQAVDDLSGALQDKTFPESEAYQAAETLFQLVSDDTHELTNAYNAFAATLEQNKSKRGLAGLVKADFYLQYAWCARGHGYANEVTPEGWHLFRERLALAESALNKAWSSDPYNPQIPTLMISIVEGQKKPRADMEKWFQRAMKLDPDNYQVCRSKLHFLLPEWYGSRDDMLAFGRECVSSTNWSGQVPLILVDAHSEFARTLNRDQRKEYWLSPDVWPDIKAAYEKYSELNPDLTRFRYPYAAYAFRCGQRRDFNKQTKFILHNDIEPNYNYFGGKEIFDKMVALANPTNENQAQTPDSH